MSYLYMCDGCKVAVALMNKDVEIFRMPSGQPYPHDLRRGFLGQGKGPRCHGLVYLAPDAIQAALALGGKEAVTALLPEGWEMAG